MGINSCIHAYLSSLHGALGNVGRRPHFDTYRSALMMDVERKSVEPMANAVAPDNVSASRQRLPNASVHQSATHTISRGGSVSAPAPSQRT